MEKVIFVITKHGEKFRLTNDKGAFVDEHYSAEVLHVLALCDGADEVIHGY